MGIQEWISSNIKCVRLTFERLNCGRNVLSAPDFRGGDFEAERTGNGLDLAQLHCGNGIADIR